MSVRRVLAAVLLAAAMVVRPLPAAGQSEDDLAAARLLGQEGLALFDKGEYEAALAKLDAAAEKAKIPPLGLYAARALARLGRLIQAEARYQEVLSIPLPPNSPAVWSQAKVDAEDELAKLRATIPTIEVVLRGVDAAQAREVVVQVDGRTVKDLRKVPVDPGPHEVAASLDGVVRTAQARVDSGKHVRIEIAVGPQDTSVRHGETGPSPTLIAGGVLLGAGGAGLIVWGGTGLAAMAKADEYGCDGASCPREDVSDITALRLTSTVSFYVGGGLALVGGSLLVVSAVLGGEATEDTSAVRPILGPGYAGLEGRF